MINNGYDVINKMFERGYFNKTVYNLCIKELKKNNGFNEYLTKKFKNIL